MGFGQLRSSVPLGHVGGQPVEAQDVAQHAPEARAKQVARAARTRVFRLEPLHSRPSAWLCTENDMSDGAVSTPNSREQANEVRIGAVVEDQEARVHAVGRPLQRDVHRVGVTAEVAARLEQRDLRLRRQGPRRRQPGDAGADHCDAPDHRTGPWSPRARRPEQEAMRLLSGRTRTRMPGLFADAAVLIVLQDLMI